MTTRQTRSMIRGLLQYHGVHPRRSLGQNFLADPNIVERIVRVAAVSPGDRVLEIGSGTGALTVALAAAGASVVAYEADTRLEPVLREALEGIQSVDLRLTDVMSVDLQEELGSSGWIMVANLPYNIGMRLLIRVLKEVPAVERAVVMLQREVADRLVATAGTPSFGLATVAVSLRASVQREFDVPPEVFLPRPDVESTVVSLTRITAHPAADRADVLAAAAFNQRRKMLRRSLAGAITDPEAVLEAAGIDPMARAEDLDPADYVRLAEEAR